MYNGSIFHFNRHGYIYDISIIIPNKNQTTIFHVLVMIVASDFAKKSQRSHQLQLRFKKNL